MKKIAICIIETRAISDLVKIINDHLKYLPKNDLFIYNGYKTLYLEKMFPKSTFKYLPESFDLSAYNKLLTSKEFWKQFLDYDKVYIMQSDGGILRKGLEEFYDFDMVGAAYAWQDHGCNGGESLRTPKVMYDICCKEEWDITKGNEDVFFSNYLYNNPSMGKLAPRDICNVFGAEGVFNLGTFSYHAIDKYLTPEQCESIKKQYL